MTVDPGTTLGVIRERKPLVHNITNYVVMNETANAILALGALPVMAHAKDEVREMVGLAGALVLNIGTLSEDWIEAMLLAGTAANESGSPGRARSGRGRRDGLPHGDGEADPRAPSTSPSCAATRGRWRRSSVSRPRFGASSPSEPPATQPSWPERQRARSASSRPSRGRSTTFPTASGRRRWRTATRCSRRSPARAACRRRSPAAFSPAKDDRFEAAVEALVAFGVAGEDAAVDAKGPGSFHVNLYDALAALDPATLSERAKVDVG